MIIAVTNFGLFQEFHISKSHTHTHREKKVVVGEMLSKLDVLFADVVTNGMNMF